MRRAADDQPLLNGEQVLVVEDDFLISLELASILSAAGAEVVGPSRTVAQALALIGRENVSAAVLDVRLGHETVEPVARDLSKRNIPFVFYTGQVRNDPFWSDWPESTIVSKPAEPYTLVTTLAAVCKRRS